MTITTAKSIGFTTQIDHEIEYAEGVRRKILFKDEKLQTMLMCLSAGTQVPLHTAPHHGVIHVIEGRGIFTLGDQEIELKPGVLIVMPAQAPHAIRAIDNVALLKVVEAHQGCSEHDDK